MVEPFVTMTKTSSHFDDCSLPLHLANPPAALASLADKIVHLRRMGRTDAVEGDGDVMGEYGRRERGVNSLPSNGPLFR